MLLFFSDLDGTILDDRYDPGKAMEGIRLLREAGIPLILISSKTFEEMCPYHKCFSLDSPLVFENGGGIALPRVSGPGFDLQITGAGIDELERAMPFLRDILKEDLRTIREMSIEEIVSLTGLPPEAAETARVRRASLPFVLPSGRRVGTDELREACLSLKAKALTVTRGARFFHLHSLQIDKGRAALLIADYYRKQAGAGFLRWAAAGDGENDLPLLREADYSCLIRRRDGIITEEGLDIPVTGAEGPEGFTEAVGLILEWAGRLKQ